MTTVEQNYNEKLLQKSDIHEHLPTLKKYAEECNHVTEMGVRKVVSTYALLMGKPKKMISIDKVPIEVYHVDRNWLRKIAAEIGVDFQFIDDDTTRMEIEETDLLFIDTKHTYFHLKKELELHANKVKKYIILHDTTTFENYGEDRDKGLWPAIEEFLEQNKNWSLHERFINNNGLTVLKNN